MEFTIGDWVRLENDRLHRDRKPRIGQVVNVIRETKGYIQRDEATAGADPFRRVLDPQALVGRTVRLRTEVVGYAVKWDPAGRPMRYMANVAGLVPAVPTEEDLYRWMMKELSL